MTPEQRKEIERALHLAKLIEDNLPGFDPLQVLAQFARQQLNLRVDGERLREEAWRRWGINFRHHDIRLIEALILECLTTTPEEKE